MNHAGIKITLFGLGLLLVAMACRLMSPKTAEPGSLQEVIQGGNIRFEGNGNLTYGECMDPTARVSMTLSAQVKEYEGQTYNGFINPVSVNALTDGAIPWSGDCEKTNQDEIHDWPAKGLYYPDEEKILFYTCSLRDGKADGVAYLTGEGNDLYFEGVYGCLGADGEVVYEIAFSVFRVAE